jgi:hypothetical protein
MLTEEQTADFERRFQELWDKGEADFGSERVAELIAIGRGPEPSEAEDTRRLAELIWWKDVNDVWLDAVPPMLDFSVRVNEITVQHGLENPDDLPPEIRGPLQNEGVLTMRVRQAASRFGLELE